MHTLFRQVFVAILGGVVAAGVMLVANQYKPGPTMALAQSSITEVPATSPEGVDAPTVDATKMINYQGQIFNPATGQPYINTPLNTTISIWDSATGGAQLYIEDRFIQTNADGFFSVNIGELPNSNLGTFSIFNGEARYLQVVIMGQQLTPRQPLTFVPFAMWSIHAHHLDDYDADDFPKIVAYGVVNDDGTRGSGDDFSSSLQRVGGQDGVYVVDLDEDFSINDYTVVLNTACQNPIIHGIGSSEGNLVVDIWDRAGNRVRCRFQFMVLKK